MSQTPWLDAAIEGSAAGAGAEPLEERLLGAFAASPTFEGLDAMVAAAPTIERQQAYRSAPLHAAIAASGLSPAEQLALSTALAEGSLSWGALRSGHRGSDFYAFFAMNDGKGPPPAMEEMNCYELVLYSAWRLGQITTDWLVKAYENEGGLESISWEELGFSDRLPRFDPTAGAVPTAGQMVFVSHPGEPEPWHAVLALSADTAMSLWKRPEPDTPARRSSLTEYATTETVQFGPAPWHG